MTDHPRVCGEQKAYHHTHLHMRGSSPRVRGTEVAERLVEEYIGIIPACAGNSYCRCASSQRRRDHPRVCGEQLLKSLISAGSVGSSPRVRGTVNPYPTQENFQ